MSDRNERGRGIEERLSKRFQTETEDTTDETEERGNPAKTSKTEQTESTSTKSQTDEKDSNAEQTSVKDRPSVLMYLPADVRTELDIRFDELNARHKREYGDALEKNRDYYPAVVEAGLTGEDLEDILDV